MPDFFHGVKKKAALSWAFYDFANSSYSLLILSFVFPIFYKEAIAGQKLGDFYWGLITSLSILAGGLVSPIVGAIADYDARRKRKWILFSLLAMVGTALLYFTGSGSLLFASLVFMAANFFFELGQTLYDSFLLHVSTPANAGRISGLGYGLGYIGGVAAMLLLRPLYAGGFAGPLQERYLITFPLTALFCLLFSLPAFIFVRDRPVHPRRASLISLAKIGIRNAARTLRHLHEHRQIAWFLLGFYLMNDALVTLYSFVSIYAHSTLSLSLAEIAIILLVIQLVGFPSAVAFGWLSDRRGSKRILLFTLAIWALIVVLASVVRQKPHFYVIAVLTGLVVGSSNAIARSWLSKLIPPNRHSEFFGFNGFASKIAATTGPLVFGAVSVLSGSQRLAMLALLPFFLAAGAIFARIPDVKQVASSFD